MGNVLTTILPHKVSTFKYEPSAGDLFMLKGADVPECNVSDVHPRALERCELLRRLSLCNDDVVEFFDRGIEC